MLNALRFSSAVNQSVSLHRVSGMPAIRFLIVAAALLCPVVSAMAQDSSASILSPAQERIGLGQMFNQPIHAVASMGWKADESTGTRSFVPIIAGVVIGASIGAFVGHELDGKGYSCPTAPGYSCDKSRTSTFVGASLGAVAGGIAGAVFRNRRD